MESVLLQYSSEVLKVTTKISVSVASRGPRSEHRTGGIRNKTTPRDIRCVCVGVKFTPSLTKTFQFVLHSLGYFRHANTQSWCHNLRKCIQKFPDGVITKYTLTFGITRWKVAQRVMAAKLTRLTHKIAIQLTYWQRAVPFAVLAPVGQFNNFWIHPHVFQLKGKSAKSLNKYNLIWNCSPCFF
jgi:hypothetical protein